MPPSEYPHPTASPVEIPPESARPRVTYAEILTVFYTARHILTYHAPHILIIDALISATTHGATRGLTRHELLTLYRCIGFVHLAANILPPNTPVQSPLEAIETTIFYTKMRARLPKCEVSNETE